MAWEKVKRGWEKAYMTNASASEIIFQDIRPAEGYIKIFIQSKTSDNKAKAIVGETTPIKHCGHRFWSRQWNQWIYQMSIGHVPREMSEEGLLGPLDGYLVKPLQGGRLFEVNATAAGMNQSFAGKRLGSRCRERFGEVTVSLYAFFDWLSLNQTWSNHNNQSDEAKISGAAKESSMQKHVNSFKHRKTRVSNSRLVRVLNIILRKGASSLDQSQSEDQGLLGATSKYVLIGRNFNPSSLSNSACVPQKDWLRFNFRSISLAEARKISYLRFNFRHKVRFKDKVYLKLR